MGSLGTGELLIILLIILVVFGGARLLTITKSLGQAQKEFRSGADTDDDASEDTKKSKDA